MVVSNRKYLSQAEMAEELGCSTRTIRRYLDRGELVYLWVGGARKVTRELFDHFIDSRQATGPLTEEEDDD